MLLKDKHARSSPAAPRASAGRSPNGSPPKGARVAVLDIKEELARAVFTGPEAEQHLGFACDIADSKSVDAAFAKIKAALGTVDMLVNNAGIGRGPNDGSNEMYAGIAERQAQLGRGEEPTSHPDQMIHMSDEGWARVIGVNLTAQFYCARAAVRIMVENGIGGSIVDNIALDLRRFGRRDRCTM